MRLTLTDLRFALRMLRKNPGFTAVAVLTLALGIGANTAIFGLLEAVALRELPVSRPEQLVLLQWTRQKPPAWYASYSLLGCASEEKVGSGSVGCSFPYPVLDQFRSRAKSFSGIFLFTHGGAVYVPSAAGEEEARAELVSGEFFSTLGVRALLGRTLELGDDLPGAQPVAFLSHAFWKSHFGANPGMVGKVISLSGAPFTIAGIAPEAFLGLQPVSIPDLWIPLHSAKPGLWNSRDERTAWLGAIGRLRPGVSLEQARAELEVIFRRGLPSDPRAWSGPDMQPGIALSSAARGLHALRLRFLPTLEVLAAAAGLVLLIACANIASLLVARTRSRQKELATRLAVGAGRQRLVRQLLTESLVLAALGCTAGLPLAWLESQALAAFMASGTTIPMLVDVRPSWSLFGFAAAVSLIAAMLFGLAPGLAGTFVEPAAALKAAAGLAGGSAQSGRHRGRVGRLLVTAETALALVLLVGAGLFLRTLINLKTLDPGFRRDHLLAVQVSARPGGGKADTLRAIYPVLQSKLAVLPGVASVTWSSSLLLVGSRGSQSLGIEGRPDTQRIMVASLRVGPRFFETMGIPVLAGRSVRPEDCQGNAKAAWVNQALARRYFPNGSALRQRIQGGYLEIVGVVGDAKYETLRSEIEPTIFVPGAIGYGSFVLRTASNPMSLEGVVRRAISDVAPGLRINRVSSLMAQIDEELFNERMLAKLSTVFGLLALTLAAVGVYGVAAYSVTRRTREIAIRVSLGAMPWDVAHLVAAEGLWPAAIGAASGLVASYGLTRLVTKFLYGVEPLDSLTLMVAPVVLIGVAALACYVPMRKALRVEPMAALRGE